MSFDEKRLENLRGIATHAQLDATQDAMVRELTTIVAPRVGLDPIPCRGAWLSAIKRWQDTHGKVASSVSAATPQARLKAANEIRDLFRDIVLEMLTDKRRAPELERALVEAHAVYVAKYQARQAGR